MCKWEILVNHAATLTHKEGSHTQMAFQQTLGSADGGMNQILMLMMASGGQNGRSPFEMVKTYMCSYAMQCMPAVCSTVTKHAKRFAQSYLDYAVGMVHRKTSTLPPILADHATRRPAVVQETTRSLALKGKKEVDAIMWYLCDKCTVDRVTWMTSGCSPEGIVAFKMTPTISCTVTKREVKDEETKVVDIVYEAELCSTVVDTKALITFVKTCINDKTTSEQNEGKVFHHRLLGFDAHNTAYTERVPFESPKQMSNLYLSDANEHLLKGRLDTFMNKREWYDKNGVPHTLTVLLHGPPGTGKTSFIKALANKLGRHVFSVDLGLVRTPQQLQNLFCNDVVSDGRTYKTLPVEERLYVIEEIDCMPLVRRRMPSGATKTAASKASKKARRTVAAATMCPDDDDESDDEACDNEEYGEPTKNGLTLGHLLEVLDGLRSHVSHKKAGRAMIWTTNCIDALDEALLRPGRVDAVVELGNVDAKTAATMVRNMWNCCREKANASVGTQDSRLRRQAHWRFGFIKLAGAYKRTSEELDRKK